MPVQFGASTLFQEKLLWKANDHIKKLSNLLTLNAYCTNSFGFYSNAVGLVSLKYPSLEEGLLITKLLLSSALEHIQWKIQKAGGYAYHLYKWDRNLGLASSKRICKTFLGEWLEKPVFMGREWGVAQIYHMSQWIAHISVEVFV